MFDFIFAYNMKQIFFISALAVMLSACNNNQATAAGDAQTAARTRRSRFPVQALGSMRFNLDRPQPRLRSNVHPLVNAGILPGSGCGPAAPPAASRGCGGRSRADRSTGRPDYRCCSRCRCSTSDRHEGLAGRFVEPLPRDVVFGLGHVARTLVANTP